MESTYSGGADVNKAEWWEVIKTGVAIAYVILGALAVFGPLAPYREWVLLASTILAGVASALGITLTKPTEQIANIKARKAAAK